MRRFERKLQKSREKIRQQTNEKRQEREVRNEAIRVKYGLKPKSYTELDK